MTDKPTPKEIDDLVYELRQAGKDDTYSLASAVLAKWGTPATGGGPAGTVGYTVHGTQYVNWRTKPPAHGTPIYTAPQPTQAQAAHPAPHAMDGGEDAEELRLLRALAFSVERAIGNEVMLLDIEEAYEGYDKWSAARAAQKGGE